MALQVTIARGTEGTCYKCEGKITAGQFIVFKPNYHGKSRAPGSQSKVAVHDTCSPTKTKKHGGGTKKKR